MNLFWSRRKQKNSNYTCSHDEIGRFPNNVKSTTISETSERSLLDNLPFCIQVLFVNLVSPSHLDPKTLPVPCSVLLFPSRRRSSPPRHPLSNPSRPRLCPSLYLSHPPVPLRSPRERRRASDRLNRSPSRPRAPPPRAGDCGGMFNIALQRRRRAHAVLGVNNTALSSLSPGDLGYAPPPWSPTTTTAPTSHLLHPTSPAHTCDRRNIIGITARADTVTRR